MRRNRGSWRSDPLSPGICSYHEVSGGTADQELVTPLRGAGPSIIALRDRFFTARKIDNTRALSRRHRSPPSRSAPRCDQGGLGRSTTQARERACARGADSSLPPATARTSHTLAADYPCATPAQRAAHALQIVIECHMDLDGAWLLPDHATPLVDMGVFLILRRGSSPGSSRLMRQQSSAAAFSSVIVVITWQIREIVNDQPCGSDQQWWPSYNWSELGPKKDGPRGRARHPAGL